MKITSHQISKQLLQAPKIRIIVSNFFFPDEIKLSSSLWSGNVECYEDITTWTSELYFKN